MFRPCFIVSWCEFRLCVHNNKLRHWYMSSKAANKADQYQEPGTLNFTTPKTWGGLLSKNTAEVL